MPKKTKKIIEEKIIFPPSSGSFGLGNIIAIIFLIALFGLGGIYLGKYNSQNPTQKVAATQSINYDCNEGQTVLTVLKEQAEIKTQDSEYGVYVDEINGITNDEGGFWIYYVNGEMGQVGADQYNCQTGDQVEWRFEKLY